MLLAFLLTLNYLIKNFVHIINKIQNRIIHKQYNTGKILFTSSIIWFGVEKCEIRVVKGDNKFREGKEDFQIEEGVMDQYLEQ